MFEELSEEEMKRFDEHRPELTSIQVDPAMNTNDYSAKQVDTWTVKVCA